jgi:hypothetical protein
MRLGVSAGVLYRGDEPERKKDVQNPKGEKEKGKQLLGE